ncbi:tRNA methyltransferase [archaeon]|nr:tRNA methyltransferase [archaeon]|tara:strand:+ start:2946 stop:3866 length:921 start_codon:yes stop_codon:yes gene_type:complete
MVEFKESFIETYKELTNIKDFKEYSLKKLIKSIRVNTLKISILKLKKRLENQGFKLKQIPWCKEGFWVIKGPRTDLGNLKEHSLGYIYIQEAASMIPPLDLKPTSKDLVLDMSAAPGSKTTQLASMMKNRGLIVANDYKYDRLKALNMNLQRSGVSNTIITLSEGRHFLKSEIKFDKILLDAPCSGTGAIRKSLKTLQMWNPNMFKKLAGTQKQLISVAFSILKNKGTLVYSTCSVAPEENEAIIDFLLKENSNAKLQSIDLQIKKSDPILEYKKDKYSKEIKKCLRIWPQDNDTEGFFIAKIKKN